jgi:hypothetical protein
MTWFSTPCLTLKKLTHSVMQDRSRLAVSRILKNGWFQRFARK